jgi:tRNA pseudouridine55 synthase
VTKTVYEHGFLVVDKEPGMTSHDVVAIARRALNTRKVGHAGTLDPMATGVLVLGFNNGTRLLQYITDGDKSYKATIVLGASTITDDFEGEVIATADASKITDDQIYAELNTMRGTFMQRPSSVSAVKVDGERAYDRVRAGEVVVLASIEVTCSAGTYIRSIARDCGDALKVGGHLSALRRTRVAGFGLAGSVSLAALKAGEFSTLDLSDVARATFPVRDISLDEKLELSFGRTLAPNSAEGIHAGISSSNELIALLSNVDGKAKPIAVFAAAN